MVSTCRTRAKCSGANVGIPSKRYLSGEVVSVSVRKDLLDEKDALHLEKANLVAYSHGLYHRLGDVMGFFGWSVARPEVYEKRMSALR